MVSRVVMMSPAAPIIIPVSISVSDVIILRRSCAVSLDGYDFDNVVGGVVVFGDVRNVGVVPVVVVVMVVAAVGVAAVVVAWVVGVVGGFVV